MIKELKDWSRPKFFRRFFAMAGLIGFFSSGTTAVASIEEERNALESRVKAVKELIKKNETITFPGPVEKSLDENKNVAQWYPWGNWQNGWRNWRNW